MGEGWARPFARTSHALAPSHLPLSQHPLLYLCASPPYPIRTRVTCDAWDSIRASIRYPRAVLRVLKFVRGLLFHLRDGAGVAEVGLQGRVPVVCENTIYMCVQSAVYLYRHRGPR